MGAREVLFRAGRKLAGHVERLAFRRGWFDWSADTWRQHLCDGVDDPPSSSALAAWWQHHMRSRLEPAFLLDADTLAEATDLYRCQFADQLELLVQAADRVCEGEFAFLGTAFQSEDPIDWQRDPQTGRSWPRKFHADVRIPFCDGKGVTDTAGDVKYVWELNRHEFLIDCAKAFYLTGDTKYARRVFDVIASWNCANPYLEGVNWAGPLEVAVRSLAWLWAYQFCRHWDDLEDELHLELIQSFYRHGAYLYRHLEFYSSPNNHLVGEATALYLLGSFFPEFGESAAWRKKAWDVLEAEPRRQFYNDGGTTEHATSYHYYCLGFFLLAVLTRQRQGEPVPDAMLDRLQAALSFGMWMTSPDGTVPCIGDTDDAKSIRFAVTPLWDFRNVTCVGAIMFRNPQLKAMSGSYAEDALWLLGASGYQTYRDLSDELPSTNSRAFRSSGYVVLRSGWGAEDHFLCFDCGPIGVDLYTQDIAIFTHGHADMLSLTASAFGKPLLVDSGFYTYNGPPAWHRYCRDVSGHNTVRVDGASQAKFNTSNAWSCVATPGPSRWVANEEFEFAEGSHAGFFGVPSRVRHRRAVYWKRGPCWLILDRLEGDGTHTVDVFFHFAPGEAQRLPDGHGAYVTTKSGIRALLQSEGTNPLRLEINHGDEEPEGGWIATSYGQRVPAPVLKFHGEVDLPFKVTFSLSFCRDETTNAGEMDCLQQLTGEVVSDALALERVVMQKRSVSNVALR